MSPGAASPDWWLDELAHAGADHLDPGYVAGYEAKAGYLPDDDIAALERAGIDRDSTVVDLGAGTGTFALAMAPRCRRLVAVDVSPAMVDVLRRRAVAADLAGLTVEQAGFLSYEHAGDPADAVFTRNALHQLPDFWKAIALRRIATTLRAGGVLRVHDLIFDIEPADVTARMETWMAGAATDRRRGYVRAELAEHVRTEFSTYTWLFEPMLERVGFTIVERSVVRHSYAAYTCRRSDDPAR